MDDDLYRLHAEREETYWWWVAKNRIIMHLIDRYLPATVSTAGHRNVAAARQRPLALDIGCGAGGVLAKLKDRFEATGIDMSPIAREHCAKRGLRALDGSLPDGLPFKDANTFDLVVMSEVLEHVPDDRASVREVVRIVKPGGLIVCTVPAHMWLWSSHDDFNQHQRRYTRRGFGALWEALPAEKLVLSYANAIGMLPLAAVRLSQKLLRPRPAGPEVTPLPGPLNALLRVGFEMEKHLIPRTGVPWGSSVMAVYRKSGTN